MRYNDEDAVIFKVELLSYLFITFHFKSVHYNKLHLLIWITLSSTYIFEIKKYNFLKKSNAIFRIGPMIFTECYFEIFRKRLLR